ncbi:hypothetical protein K7432_000249 [Basidiobolus ranarum]|uniref:Uncharacterized protein n=1 Tax=Basidiobolus ranarum TaxID=34480 RepID=A0ABR2X5B2_9FUNG
MFKLSALFCLALLATAGLVSADPQETVINQPATDAYCSKSKKNCQQYCLQHQYYNVQYNRCYGQETTHVLCWCDNHDLTSLIIGLNGNNSASAY